MSQTTQFESETTESSEPEEAITDEEQEKLDFQGKAKKLGLGMSVTAAGGAIVYAFGIVVIIATLVAAVVAFGLYLKYK